MEAAVTENARGCIGWRGFLSASFGQLVGGKEEWLNEDMDRLHKIIS